MLSVSNLVKMTDYNTKINEIKKKSRENKTDFNNKLNDVTSNKNQLNELSKKIKAISTKGVTKDLINEFSILNGAKYFFFRHISKLFSIYTSYKTQ